MIYKFIDNNGSEITVNSLSSLQALVDSDTINEDTKVKAGLRGKWTTASSIEGLVFSAEESNEDNQETELPKGDIKSFITGEEKRTKTWRRRIWVCRGNSRRGSRGWWWCNWENRSTRRRKSNFDNENENQDTSDYYTEKFNQNNEDEEDAMVLSFPDAVKKCFKKYFDLKVELAGLNTGILHFLLF